MDRIEEVEKAIGKDIPFNFRAYYTTYVGDFDVLQDHVTSLKGVAYEYAHGYSNDPAESQNAIVMLPSGATLKIGKTLSSEGRTCEIISSGWISTP